MDVLFNYLSAKYGVQMTDRFFKLDEEYSELTEAYHEYLGDPSVGNHMALVDELADVNILVFHIAGILGYSQSDLLTMAADKIRRRETDPNYKRKTEER